MDLNGLKLLVEIVEAGNLSAAARRLNTSRSNISHRLRAFEQSLGVTLLRRNTTRVEPTQIGHALYEHGAKIVREMQKAEDAVSTLGKSPRGHVRVSMPISYGAIYLAPVLIEFANQYPEISLQVVFNNRVHDLLASEVDIALRITSSPPEEYVAREIADIAWILCASPAYIQTTGAPSQPADLASHAFVSSSEQGGQFTIRLARGSNVEEVLVRARIQSDNYLFLKKSLIAGLGMGLLPLYVVQADLAAGRLCAVLPDYEAGADGDKLFLITTQSRHLAHACRLLVDFLKSRLPSEEPRSSQAIAAAARHGSGATQNNDRHDVN